MNYIDYFMGRPVEFWAELDHVMRKHGIDNPKQLSERLDPHKRTSVYDSRNNDRLLGTIPKPDMRCSHMRMAVQSLASVCDYPSNVLDQMTVTTVGFDVGIKRGPNPLDVRGVLHTSDPLSTLMKVRDFRLPGESAEQAERRRYNY